MLVVVIGVDLYKVLYMVVVFDEWEIGLGILWVCVGNE